MTAEFDFKTAFSLAGKRAFVTGGGAGIGQAIAVALARAGADVAFTTHSRPGDDTRRGIEEAGRKALGIPLDLSAMDADAAERLVADLGMNFGPLDILVNNAGIIRRADALVHGEDDWRAVMATNLDAVWFLSQAAARRMQLRKSGRIIMIASLLSFQGGIRVPGYAASKHAVAGLTKALANELAAHGICVNAIAPGYIATENTKALRADPDRSRQILERIPAGRWGEATDIAGAAVFLASPASGYIQGTILTVDGGWMAR